MFFLLLQWCVFLCFAITSPIVHLTGLNVGLCWSCWYVNQYLKFYLCSCLLLLCICNFNMLVHNMMKCKMFELYRRSKSYLSDVSSYIYIVHTPLPHFADTVYLWFIGIRTYYSHTCCSFCYSDFMHPDPALIA